MSDFTKVESAKHLLQVAIECCIDVGHHIIAAESWRAPRNYADTFVVLNERGILPDDFVPVTRQMVRFRNRVVHLYWEVDDEIVYQTLQTNLGDFDRFSEYVLDFFPDTQEGTKSESE